MISPDLKLTHPLMRGYMWLGGFMVDMLSLAYNTGNLRFLGVLNGLRRRCSGGNDNGCSVPLHKRLIFPCLFLLLFLSGEPPPVHINSALGISPFYCILFILII